MLEENLFSNFDLITHKKEDLSSDLFSSNNTPVKKKLKNDQTLSNQGKQFIHYWTTPNRSFNVNSKNELKELKTNWKIEGSGLLKNSSVSFQKQFNPIDIQSNDNIYQEKLLESLKCFLNNDQNENILMNTIDHETILSNELLESPEFYINRSITKKSLNSMELLVDRSKTDRILESDQSSNTSTVSMMDSPINVLEKTTTEFHSKKKEKSDKSIKKNSRTTKDQLELKKKVIPTEKSFYSGQNQCGNAIISNCSGNNCQRIEGSYDNRITHIINNSLQKKENFSIMIGKLIYQVIIQNHLEKLSLVLNSINRKEVEFSVPLIVLSSKFCNNHVIGLLIQSNTNINATDNKGWTALHWCCALNNIMGVAMLCQAGADLNMQSLKNKKNPKDLAFLLHRQKIIELLTEEEERRSSFHNENLLKGIISTKIELPIQKSFSYKENKNSKGNERTNDNKKKFRYCVECNGIETPQWRRGPDGNVNLCNACGLKFKKRKRKNDPETKLKSTHELLI